MKAFREKLEEKNKLFESMDLTGQRLAIVNDLKDYVLSSVLIPTCGTYLRFVRPDMGWKEIEEFHAIGDMVDVLGTEQCNVCVKGGILAAVIGFEDNFSTMNTKNQYSGMEVVSGDLMPRISKFWHPFELALMEVAFEESVTTGGYFYDKNYYGNGYTPVFVAHGHSDIDLTDICNAALECVEGDTTARILGVIEIILANNGRFILPGFTVEQIDQTIIDLGTMCHDDEEYPCCGDDYVDDDED